MIRQIKYSKILVQGVMFPIQPVTKRIGHHLIDRVCISGEITHKGKMRHNNGQAKSEQMQGQASILQSQIRACS